MTKTFLLFYVLAVCPEIFAQNDSIILVDAKWTQKKVTRGIVWKTVRFTKNELFNSNQNINLIEIRPALRKVRLSVAHSDSLEKTSQIAHSRNAIAGINGSFFTMRGADPDYRTDSNRVKKMEPSKIERNRSIDYLRENNHLIAENLVDKGPGRKRHQQGSLAINNGRVFILKGDSIDLNWEQSITAQDVLSSGPLLLLSGNNERIPNDAFCNDRHPRTAVGKKANGTVILFVVDGRTPESSGMSIIELQKTLRWLGCVDALNLDGGGSTTMYIKGQPHHGVVNYPTDNKKFDHEGEREVANAIMILKQ